MPPATFFVTEDDIAAPPGRIWWVVASSDGGAAFRLTTPVGFDPVPAGEDLCADPPFAAAARFASEDGLTATVAVSYLSREVDPDDWYEISLPGRKRVVFEYPHADQEMPAYTLRDAGDATGLRTIARVYRNGSRVFAVEVSGPPDQAAQGDRAAKVVLPSLRFTAPAEFPFAEPLHSIHIAGVVPCRFLCPASWTRRDTADGCEMRHEIDETCVAKLLVRSTPSGGRVGDVFEALATIARESGVRLSGAPIHAQSPYGRFERVHFCAAAGRAGDTLLDVPMIALDQPTHRFALALIGPARESSPTWWAIGKTALRIVRDTISTPEECARLLPP